MIRHALAIPAVSVRTFSLPTAHGRHNPEGTKWPMCTVLDREFRHVEINAPLLVHFQRGREEMIGRTIWENFPGLDATPLGRAIRNVMHGRAVTMITQSYARPDCRLIARLEPCAEGLRFYCRAQRLRRHTQPNAERQTPNEDPIAPPPPPTPHAVIAMTLALAALLMIVPPPARRGMHLPKPEAQPVRATQPRRS